MTLQLREMQEPESNQFLAFLSNEEKLINQYHTTVLPSITSNLEYYKERNLCKKYRRVNLGPNFGMFSSWLLRIRYSSYS